MSSLFVLYFKENHLSNDSRLGVIASRKVGNAVARNRIKRFVREWFRLNSTINSSAMDLVVIARKRASSTTLRTTTLTSFVNALVKNKGAAS